MKFLYILLIVLLVGLTGFSFYYTNIHKGTLEYKATENLTDESLYMYREYGDISYKNSAKDTDISLTETKTALPNHVFIKTGDGRGYILFPDNSSIALSTSTEVEIISTPTKISVIQLRGTTYHRVSKVENGNTYETQTPNTLTLVLGTKLAVTYNPALKKTFIAVTEHSVEVTEVKEDRTILKAPVIVQEGSLADVQSATNTSKTSSTTASFNKVSIQLISDNKEVSLLVDENTLIDKEYDKVSPSLRKDFLEALIDSLQKDRDLRTAATTTSEVSTSTSQEEPRKATITRVLGQSIKTSSITPKTKEVAQTTKITPTTSAPAPKTQPAVAPLVSSTSKLSPEIPKTNGDENGTSGGTVLRSIPITAEELTPTDEAFIDAFYAVYEKYYLVDDPIVYCAKIGSIGADDIIKSLLVVTNKAGVILPSQPELTSFAQDLVNACKDGSMQAKSTTFKARFDVVYPY